VHRADFRNNEAWEEVHQTSQEIAPVPLSLEPQKVEVEEMAQELPPPGEFKEDIRGGKGNMQKEGGSQVDAPLPELMGHAHEVVVVHPEKITFVSPACDFPGKATVSLCVAFVVAFVKTTAPLKVVKERPDRGVGEPVVVGLPQLFREHHGNEVEPLLLREIGRASCRERV
jgi:hypothetical protein